MKCTGRITREIAVVVAWMVALAPCVPAQAAAESPESPRQSQYPRHPEQYVPMPIPVQSESASTLRGPCYVVTYDCRTGKQTVGPELASDSLEELVSMGTANTGLCPWPDSIGTVVQPRSFSELTGVVRPKDFPWRAVCKLLVDFRAKTGETIRAYGSGILIDPNHVLTAGHCIFQHVAEIDGVNYTIESLPTKVVVVPGYQEEVRPFGDAGALGYMLLSEWVGDENSEYDVGLIQLDRPVGAITNHSSYGTQSDPGFFTTTLFHNAGYPSETPYVGERMYYWNGLFDGTTYNPSTQRWEGNSLILNQTSYHGQSGSGAYTKSADGTYTAYAVLSHGAGQSTHFVRIMPAARDAMADFIKGNASPSADLTPLAVQVSPAEVSLGGTVSGISFLVHNAAAVSWSGRLEFDVILSRDWEIGGEDAALGPGYYLASASIAPGGVLAVGVPPVALPAAKGPGCYWIGAKLRTYDWDQTNNATGPQDVAPVTMGIHKLANDVPETYAYYGQKDFAFDVTKWDWCCIGISPTKDYNLRVSENIDFVGVYEHSTSSGTARDFVVVNGRALENDVTHFARVGDMVGGIYTLEAAWDIADLTVGTAVSDSIDAGEVHQMYEVALTGGKTYDLSLNIRSGGADLSVYVFKPTQRSGSRSNYGWKADQYGPYGGEHITLAADSTGFYGIAVLNENAKAAEYSIGINVAE